MRHGRLSGLLLFIGCLIASTSLRAQTVRAPTDGLQLPDRSVTTQSNASSVEVNPAGLGFIESAEVRYSFELDTRTDDDPFADRHGFFAGAGNDWIGGGFSVQMLDRPVLGDSRVAFQKYSLAGAIRPLDNWSIGAGFHSFGSGANRRLNELSSVDLGVQWRPSRRLGFGLALRDTNHPFLRLDRGLPVRLQGGAALRLFNGQLVFDNQVNWAPGDEADLLAYQPRIDITPFSGFRLFGRADIPLNDNLVIRQDIPTRVFGGLEFSLGRIGLASASSFRTVGGNEDGYAGQSQSIWLTPRPRPAVVEPSNRWVKITLKTDIAERAFDSPLAGSKRSFLDLQMYLRELANDSSVEGVLLKIEPNNLGYGQIWELRRQIAHLQESGKQTVAFLTAPSFSGTYLASAAAQVYLLPSTPLSPEGIRSTKLNYARALSNIGVEAEFLRIGEYKSAPEAYVRREPSEPALEQTKAYVDGLYNEVVGSIAENRDMERDKVDKAVDNIPILPDQAANEGYVDKILYADEVQPTLRRQYGAGTVLSDRYDPNPAPTQGWDGVPEVAVVYVDGNIVRGKSNDTPIFGGVLSGSETITDVLAELGRDPSVRAIVVRVDSPGGSAVASDQIYRQMRRVSQVKPVITSMGDVAASGGYYIAAGGDTIFATPNTLTGSIGIFTGKFSIGQIADVLGINQTEIERGDRAGQFEMFDKWTEEQRKRASKSIHYMYRLFLEQVSNTRPLDSEQVDEVARGRVWLGSAAKEEHLVDEMGGLVDAIRHAEEVAGIPRGAAKYRSYPTVGSLIDVPFAQMGTIGKIAQFLGLTGETGGSRGLQPRSALQRILDRVKRAALLPLIYDQGEPLMLPPQPLVVE